MKLSSETLTYFKAFSNINPSLYIASGQYIKTQHPTGDHIVGIAKVKETFPKDFAIYDLQKFLGVLSLFNDPDFDFGDKSVIIKEGNNKVKFNYANPSMIVHPDYSMELQFPKPYVSFTLEESVINRITKAMSILKADLIYIRGVDGNITISSNHSKMGSEENSDKFSTIIGETDKNFTLVLESKNLMILPRTYTVDILQPGYGLFKSDDLTYLIAGEAKTTKFE